MAGFSSEFLKNRAEAEKNEMKSVLSPRAPRERAKTWLRWTERGLLVLGLGSLTMWCAINLRTYTLQRRVKADFSQMSHAHPNLRESPHPPLKDGDFVGEIDIPDLGISAIILEGSDEHILRLGIGHIPGTALPGDRGNVSLAAHRDTFFRPLRRIRKNDVIQLTTYNGSYKYRVDWTKVVRPGNISVLRPSRGATLTLITCYPFYFVGPAPDRFVVRAHRISMGINA